MLARTITHAVVGLDARRVDVEAHLQGQVPGFAIVGLADRACQEAKERVRSGITSASLDWPVRRITVNLAPACLPNEIRAAPTNRTRPPGSHRKLAGSDYFAAFSVIALILFDTTARW